ncbi:MAG TPA: efflux RND transporter permease subunit, partial [Planctomicrobium sp.]|nr:efflux RND transporter permease subunit [Planctomicrobium sp.]
GKHKGTIGTEIERIPLVTKSNGVVLTVQDLATVRDEFADVDSQTRINGKPGMVIGVERTSTEDLLAMTDAIHAYVRDRNLPPGYSLEIWGDQSVEVRDRLNLLTKNGFQGLVLVVITLALFLNMRLAFWVSMGIPISILGACALLYFGGETLNMLTSFTFVMALGIVVDDAIIVGENVHAHRLMGKSPLQAAIDGTLEVAPSVITAILTTIVAFVPLLFVSGVMGKFIAVMPVAMISILLISLFESIFILPCHLAHKEHEGPPPGPLGIAKKFYARMPVALRWTLGPFLLMIGFVLDLFSYPLNRLGALTGWLNVWTEHVMLFSQRWIYEPILRYCIYHPVVVMSSAISLLLVAMALVTGGIVPFIVFPKTDSNTIEASIVFPDGTPASVTDTATRQLEEAIQRVNQKYSDGGEPILKLTRRSVGYVVSQSGPAFQEQSNGGHLGGVTAELQDVSQRTVDCHQILNDWRREAGEFPGAESLTFGSGSHGPGGTPIEFKLLARSEHMAALEAAVDETVAKLGEFPGVFDVNDDSQPGKWEFQLRMKPDAISMGVPLEQVAQTVRAAYYGEEVMRLQRGRHEVKLMVRYPRENRRSLSEFDQIRVRTGDGSERPLTELADVQVQRSYSEINRINQLRSITVSADVDEAKANAREIVQTLQKKFVPELFERYPAVSIRWEGQQEQTTESVESLLVGLMIALVAMFAILTFQFTSYIQPVLIMTAIPFGIVGAIFGHALMGLPLTLFSLFGAVTLTGVVVNDSIVLIDFINYRVRAGVHIDEALIEAGARRLRPILLTSITTVVGLFPLILEKSFQAQILIPMAVSICYGLIVSTLLVLLMVPSL